MKRLFILFVALLPILAYAYEVTKTISIDGITYEITYSSSLSGVFQEQPIKAVVIKNGDSGYSGNIVIPNTISYPLFAGKDEGDGTYDATFKVLGISAYAFINCTGLKSIFIPSNVTEFGGDNFDTPSSGSYYGCNPFAGCENLESITVDSENSVFDSRDNCNAIIRKKMDRADCTLISGCKNTVIPEEVCIIGLDAFSGCTGLTTVSLPKNVYMLCENAFAGCDNITDIYSYANNPPSPDRGSLFPESIKNAIVHVPDHVIEKYKSDVFWKMFSSFTAIEKVTDFNLVYYVDNVEYKTVQYKYDDEITPLEEPVKDGYTFSGWSEIPKNMPGKDVKIEGTFTRNEVKENGVIYHVFNESAAVIGNDNATGEVKILSSVTFNEKEVLVTDIVDLSFKNNADITSVVIPESVRMIGDEAFYRCKNLAKIELGKSVNQIEPRAFAGIDKLTDVTIYAEEVPSTDRTAFENSYTEDYVTLHVPAGSVEKYKTAAPWKNFKEIVAIPDADADDTDVDVITIKSYGKGTYCSDYDLDFSDTENLKAFIVTGYDHKTNTIWLTRVKSVPAGTGIIVKGTPGDYKVKHVESLSVYANFLVGTTEDIKIKDVEGEMTNFVLSKGEWYRFDGEITLPKGMAYLPLPLSKFAGTRSLIEVYEDNDEGTTEIRTIKQGTTSSEHDVWFNLQGQRVANPGKGLYIRNGKKVFIK